jgi:squalene-hopene/tetraprenyl-beta-curcumene cyclase
MHVLHRLRRAAPAALLALAALSLPEPARTAPARASQSAPAQPAATAPTAPAPDLGREIDASLRWLRYAQDRDSGAYGASVEATAWTLRAMILSPRKYQRIDGPFVERALQYLVARQRADGAIADEGASPADATRQTRAAAGALALHADESTKGALQRALAFLGASGADSPAFDDEPLPEGRDALLARVTELLAQRAKDGSWDGPRGKVAETARQVNVLIRALPALKPAGGATPVLKPLPPPEKSDPARVAAAIERGARYLAAQGDNGRFGAPGRPDAGLTAMAVGALIAAPKPRPKEVQDAIDAGLAWLLLLQQPDGSIHDGKYANYATSAAILALVRNGNPEHRPVIEKARDWLVGLQIDETEGYSPDDPYYGGIGYGSSERPDLSNLQFALEALAASGLKKDDPAFQRALKFLQRCQNRSESNDIAIPDGDKVIVSGDDGGAAYLPGQSFAGTIELEGGRKIARSYGSMTYALLKGYIFAGLPKEDPRMKAAWEWVSKNWTLDVNPGFQAGADPTAAYQGLYYYYHTLAKALDLYGSEVVVDAQGKQHAWRDELAGRLLGLQRKNDGAWTNENSSRWQEGNPVLGTAYALLTLELTRRAR